MCQDTIRGPGKCGGPPLPYPFTTEFPETHLRGALLQRSILADDVWLRRSSGGLGLWVLGEQRHHLSERAGSNAESAFNDAGFTTDVAGQVENRGLPLA